MERRRSETERQRAKGDQKEGTREQRDPKWEPNGCRKATKEEPKGGKGAQRAPFAEPERKSEEKGAGKHAD
jgi:hypothetical protein